MILRCCGTQANPIKKEFDDPDLPQQVGIIKLML